ncbi:MAG TPA: CDP-diacylglycerol--glycerol-3-phosphate 3-phosphatidyltransferase [Clostridiaceae bacterium]|nr:CDP-diacylglycerol--glycerol-3-phosphate 3-phosphatidyltransferase [Clostridiaceae bacterium]
MNLANKITMIRIFLIPVFLILVTVEAIPNGKLMALAIFIIASLTDKLDGHIARSRNLITNFGKFMDPLADKLLVTSALIALVEFQIIAGWVAVVIIAREFAVTGLRTIAAAEGTVIAASPWGKAKTTAQMAAIILALIFMCYDVLPLGMISLAAFKLVVDICMYIAVVATIISGADYFIKNKDVIQHDK